MAAPPFESSPRIADELKLPLAGVRAAVRLLTDGASVPFVARYRKEQTGGLDEVQLRSIEEKNAYCIELDGRRRRRTVFSPSIAAKPRACSASRSRSTKTARPVAWRRSSR